MYTNFLQTLHVRSFTFAVLNFPCFLKTIPFPKPFAVVNSYQALRQHTTIPDFVYKHTRIPLTSIARAYTNIVEVMNICIQERSVVVVKRKHFPSVVRKGNGIPHYFSSDCYNIAALWTPLPLS